MTVNELIEELRKYDGDMLVVSYGGHDEPYLLKREMLRDEHTFRHPENDEEYERCETVLSLVP